MKFKDFVFLNLAIKKKLLHFRLHPVRLDHPQSYPLNIVSRTRIYIKFINYGLFF
jgi:hypothetical protein